MMRVIWNRVNPADPNAFLFNQDGVTAKLYRKVPGLWVWEVTGPNGTVRQEQEGLVEALSQANDKIRDIFDEIRRPDVEQMLGALKAAEEYMAFRATDCSEPVPLQRVRKAIKDNEELI